jgi:hypothetical protein
MPTETNLPGHPLDVAVRAIEGTETVYVVTDGGRPKAVILDFEYYQQQVGLLGIVTSDQIIIKQGSNG